MFDIQTFIYAVLGGLLPALLWLVFWLQEDRLHPEPRKTLIASFVLGMVGTFVALPLEYFASQLWQTVGAVIIAWSFIEEMLKYSAAYVGGLRTRALNEPIDPLIYLITAALGFAAAENALFLFGALDDGGALLGVVTGNIRFVGATLLHVVASSAIGLSIALSFYKDRTTRLLYRAVGLVAAVSIHAAFNYLLLKLPGNSMLGIFGIVWLAIILLILAFEKVKRMRRPLGNAVSDS